MTLPSLCLDKPICGKCNKEINLANDAYFRRLVRWHKKLRVALTCGDCIIFGKGFY